MWPTKYRAFAKWLRKTARQARNDAKILVTNSGDARFVTDVSATAGLRHKKDAASELAGRRVSNV